MATVRHFVDGLDNISRERHNRFCSSSMLALTFRIENFDYLSVKKILFQILNIYFFADSAYLGIQVETNSITHGNIGLCAVLQTAPQT